MSTEPQKIAPKIAPDTQSRTQAERTAISDKAMLDAAIELILEHGTDKTTLAAIGEKAGYSRGLATYRFGSKAGLYDEVTRRGPPNLDKMTGFSTRPKPSVTAIFL